MTVNQNHEFSSQKTFGSLFLTTRRNEILDFLANSTIYPAYIICMHHIIEWLSTLGNNGQLLRPILWIVILLPFLNIAAANVEWRLGFRGRKWTYAVSLLLLIIFLQTAPEITVKLFVLSLDLLLIEFTIRRLIARRQFKHSKLNIFVAFLIVSLTLMSLFVLSEPVLEFAIKFFDKQETLQVITVFSVIISAINPLAEIFVSKSFRQSFSFRTIASTILTWTPLVALGSLLYFLDNLLIVSVLGVLFLVWVTVPRQLTSRQVANLASIFQSVRYDYIRKLVSPTQSPTSAIGLILDRVKLYLRRNSHWLSLLTCLILGGILIPYVLYRNEPTSQITSLLSVGIVSSFTLAAIYLIFWFIRHRPKHIVIPFVAINDDKDPNLKALAYLTTQMFVERLRQITLLLNMRQVENLSLRNDTGLALFVTSGQEQELVEQLRALGNIDAGNIKLPFGNVLAYFITLLAHTRVRGTIQRQDDHRVAIWVEFTQRDGRTIAVDMAFIPEDSVKDIEPTVLEQIVYTLSLKLIVKLGHNAHLASSWQSLQRFIDGLEAAYHRNWRHAISCYREAIHMEETARGSFGYGYYHLGASLMFQGEVVEGLKYLEIAETVGPPLAETQYMIALALFYLYRDVLHIERIIFTDIELRCRNALLLQPRFAEAHHLLGTIYYQRGHLREHVHTGILPRKKELLERVDPRPQDYTRDYNRARFHLVKSIKLYDGKIRYLPNDMLALSTVFDEQARLVQDRISATHRLADALRSLERYAEAAVNYRETLAAFPLNARTLVDLAKTYCLSKNWGKADEFLRNEVFNHEEIHWNKSANLYMGWALVGGLADRLDNINKVIDFSIDLYARITNREWRKKPNKNDDLVNKNVLRRAVIALDFAMHQYPEYIYRWRQIDWFPDLEKATRSLSIQKPPQDEKIYNAPIDPYNEYFIWHVQYWLAWRVLSYFPTSDNRVHQLIKPLTSNAERLNATYPNPEFGEIYEALKMTRSQYAETLEEDNLPRNMSSIARKYKCLRLGESIYEHWCTANQLFSVIAVNTTAITFAERWSLDVYSEISLLAAKIFAESYAFEVVEEITKKSSDAIANWSERWVNTSSDDGKYPLSYKVLQYQLSSLYAWHGYALIMQTQDVASMARNLARKTFTTTEKFLNNAQTSLSNAIQLMKYNPLALYAQALLCQRYGLFRQSADELNRLTTLIAPFDPHKYYSLDNLHSGLQPVPLNDLSKVDDIAKQLYYQERISGRRQFDIVINPMQVYIALASIYSEIGELKLATDQLLISLNKSYYPGSTTGSLLQLVYLLNQQDRFNEAITVIDDIKNQRLNLSPFIQATTNCTEPHILECLFNNSLERYHLNIQNVEHIKNQLSFSTFAGEHKGLINECLTCYFTDESPATFRELMANYQNSLANIEERYSRQEATVETLSQLAAQCMRADMLAQNFKDIDFSNTSDKKFPANLIFASQVLSLLAKDIFDFIVFRCDIRSVSALSLAELYIDLEQAEYESSEATRVMEVLFNVITPQIQTSDYVMLHNTKRYVVEQASTQLQLRRRLAYYYDTQAWVLFRKGDAESLQEASEILTNKALSLGADAALFHYHLARVYIMQLEQLWQSLTPAARSQADVPPKKAEQISTLLRLAFLHWRYAHRLDSTRTLYPRLRLTRQRITIYRERWAELQITPSME